MDYIIYGAGAIGSVLGAGLGQAGRSVTLIARRAHVGVRPQPLLVNCLPLFRPLGKVAQRTQPGQVV